MNALPATSFPNGLPFEPSPSTTLLMESLDYDWELIGLSMEEFRLNEQAQKLVDRGKAHRANYEISKSMVCAKLAREIRSRRAKIWDRREEIKARREWIAQERKRIDDESDRRRAQERQAKSDMTASAIFMLILLAVIFAATVLTWRG